MNYLSKRVGVISADRLAGRVECLQAINYAPVGEKGQGQKDSALKATRSHTLGEGKVDLPRAWFPIIWMEGKRKFIQE